jgi:hypothetical protein
MGHAPEEVGDLYSKLKDDVAFRQEWAERAGLGFELVHERCIGEPWAGVSGRGSLAVLFLPCARKSRFRAMSGRSAAWLARLVRDQEVEGSNPFAPTIFSPLESVLYATFS